MTAAGQGFRLSVEGTVVDAALAGGALTLYEAFAGQALSGGDGTTFSLVHEGRSADRPAEDKPGGSDESAEPASRPTRSRRRPPGRTPSAAAELPEQDAQTPR